MSRSKEGLLSHLTSTGHQQMHACNRMCLGPVHSARQTLTNVEKVRHLHDRYPQNFIANLYATKGRPHTVKPASQWREYPVLAFHNQDPPHWPEQLVYDNINQRVNLCLRKVWLGTWEEPRHGFPRSGPGRCSWRRDHQGFHIRVGPLAGLIIATPGRVSLRWRNYVRTLARVESRTCMDRGDSGMTDFRVW